VNDRGEVTGFATNTDPDPFAGLFFPSTTALHAFLWHAGVMRDLGTLGGLDSFGVVLNERGQVAGFSFTNEIPNPTTGIPTLDPFLLENGRMTDLGSLGGTLGLANALNNRGQVVGFSTTAGDLTFRPFIWQRGVLTDIGTLGGDNGSAGWINEAGQVVGTADLADGTYHAFVWWKGKITDLGTVGSDPCSVGTLINSSGQVIGASTDCQGTVLHAFLWENGSTIDLNALVLPGSGFTVVKPIAINERGEIAGNGTLANGDAHAVVLSPDSECDDACEARIAASQNNAAAAAQALNNAQPAIRTNAPLTPVEHFRNLMRRRYHIPRARALPQDYPN
jgi:probable HAF family extracellular repeat protein